VRRQFTPRRVFATIRPYVRFRSCLAAKGVWSDPARVLLLRLSARWAAPSDEYAQAGSHRQSCRP
jgi:hypothetical protein